MVIIQTPIPKDIAALMKDSDLFFECSLCKQVFECTTPQEEIERQFKAEFDADPNEPTELLCDECFKMVMG